MIYTSKGNSVKMTVDHVVIVIVVVNRLHCLLSRSGLYTVDRFINVNLLSLMPTNVLLESKIKIFLLRVGLCSLQIQSVSNSWIKTNKF